MVRTSSYQCWAGIEIFKHLSIILIRKKKLIQNQNETHTKVRNRPKTKNDNLRVFPGSLVKARRKHMGKIYLAKLIITPLFFSLFFFSFSPYPFSQWGHFNGSVLYGQSPAAKKLQRSNGRSLSVSGRK